MSADLFAEFGDSKSTTKPSGLTLNFGSANHSTGNLSSNNPFRQRTASPNSFGSGNSCKSPPPPLSPFDDPPPQPSQAPPPRPVSRNPFLDPNNPAPASTGFGVMATNRVDNKSPTAEELFDNLIIDDKPSSSSNKVVPRPAPTRAPSNGPPRGGMMPPRGRGGPAGPRRRPSQPQEDLREGGRMRRVPERDRNGSVSLHNKNNNTILGSPERRRERPRRNSESSVLDEHQKKECRPRRTEKRDKRGRFMLDEIDRLDATGVYGPSAFHHGGPFDAVSSVRNRNSNRAPMNAFPKDSLNNSLGGAGPLNARPDHKTFLGNHDDEAFTDYNRTAKVEPSARSRAEMPIFNPMGRESIHGDESMGLGTSTFLEGTPAARTAIQRNEEETAQQVQEAGLQRKKSLAQRFRRPPRDYANGGNGMGYGRMTNPEAAYRSAETDERNPFFREFDTDQERMAVRRTDTNPIPNSQGESPPRCGGGLERRATADNNPTTSPEAGGKAQGNGLIARVKSLKGGRRQRPAPDRPQPTTMPQAPPAGTQAV